MQKELSGGAIFNSNKEQANNYWSSLLVYPLNLKIPFHFNLNKLTEYKCGQQVQTQISVKCGVTLTGHIKCDNMFCEIK